MVNSDSNIGVWVIDDAPSAACVERLGDARRLANNMGTRVAVLLAECTAEERQDLIHHGADLVLYFERPADIGTKVCTTAVTIMAFGPRVVFAGGNAPAREWAALVAARQNWMLVSPALMVDWQDGKMTVTHLDHTGRRSCRLTASEHQTVVVTMRTGVAEACPADASRNGELQEIKLWTEAETSVKTESTSRIIPADPASVDIRHANYLVAGGRGLGGKEGFDLVRRFAETLGASVAASRMAVDLGWIEYERQVGQTGKTVEPDLYIACGISGASHHLDGMSHAKHIVAINTDPDAPIFKLADLGLVADLYAVLQGVEQRLK